MEFLIISRNRFLDIKSSISWYQEFDFLISRNKFHFLITRNQILDTKKCWINVCSYDWHWLERHRVIYGVESWNGVVKWSGVWSGVELEFGVESPLKQNNAQFCIGLVLWKVNIIAITFVFRMLTIWLSNYFVLHSIYTWPVALYFPLKH